MQGSAHMHAETPVVARAAVHPVALWLIRSYLGVAKVKFGHSPSFTILKPAKRYLGKAHKFGWHVDYPYRAGRFAGDTWPEGIRLGVQYNICVDAFYPGNGATQVALLCTMHMSVAHLWICLYHV